ncbi:dispersed gene family protein 1 (DGF-1), putative, partial [Trypanosoma cruzi]
MSGSVRNVTLANCLFVSGASLYVVGWRSDPPAGERVDVLISGLESRSGGGVVVAFVDSDFLLCKHAVSVCGAVSVSGSAVALVRSDFSSTEDYAVAFYSTVSLAGGSMLLAKGNVHD